MRQNIFNFTLDIKKPSRFTIPRIVNGDTSNVFIITVQDDGEDIFLNESTDKVLAVFRRADGQVYVQDDLHGVSFVNGSQRVVVTVYPSSFRSGSNSIELAIFSKDVYTDEQYSGLITTAQAFFTARNENLSDNAGTSLSQLPMLEQLILDAQTAVTNCNAAKTAANTAASAASTAATNANTKAAAANDAATSANLAATSADSAAANANDKASAANSAASSANSAASNANAKATAANDAATAATAAAAAANAAAAAAAAYATAGLCILQTADGQTQGGSGTSLQHGFEVTYSSTTEAAIRTAYTNGASFGYALDFVESSRYNRLLFIEVSRYEKTISGMAYSIIEMIIHDPCGQSEAVGYALLCIPETSELGHHVRIEGEYSLSDA